MNTYDKYKLTRKVHGKLNLPDPVDEAIIHLLAHQTSHSDIQQIIPEVTTNRIDDLLSQPLAQKRLAYKRRLIEKAKIRPKTPDECLDFAKQSLVRIAKTADDKTKVAALRALASVAMDERKNGAAKPPEVQLGDAALLATLLAKNEQ